MDDGLNSGIQQHATFIFYLFVSAENILFQKLLLQHYLLCDVWNVFMLISYLKTVCYWWVSLNSYKEYVCFFLTLETKLQDVVVPFIFRHSQSVVNNYNSLGRPLTTGLSKFCACQSLQLYFLYQSPYQKKTNEYSSGKTYRALIRSIRNGPVITFFEK